MTGQVLGSGILDRAVPQVQIHTRGVSFSIKNEVICTMENSHELRPKPAGSAKDDHSAKDGH
jgi:hypothetical protein